MLATSACAFIAVAAPAFAETEADAEDSAPAAADDSGGARLQDIVVSGEKRETNLQDVPLAITAIDGQTLSQRNFRSLDDLSGYVPGLNVTNNQGAERVFTIRGIGYETASNPNSFPGVAFHINGIYIAHSHAAAQDLIDIDRIEVLRGPQGTVFGETSTGGAINVILKQPQIGVTEGRASVSYGNYNFVKLDGAVNAPLTDTLAVRMAAQYVYHDGYGYSIGVPGKDKYYLDDANRYTGRIAILWQPSSTFSATLEAQAFTADQSGPLQKSVTDTTPGARVVDQDLEQSYELDTSMFSLTLNNEFSDTIVGKSVTAYQYMHHYQITESDRTSDPNQLDHLLPWEDISKTFSQEVTLSSQNTQLLEWTVGGLYLRQRALQNIFELAGPFNSAGVSPDGDNYLFQTDSPYQHTSIGVYGQAILHPTDSLSITAGARYSWDKVTAQPYQFYNVIPPRASKSDAITGKISVDYELTPANSVYVTASTGYKPSGVSFVSGAPFEAGSFSSGPQIVGQTFKKETVTALELGTKNEFFDRRVRLNVAGYYYWYKDFQFNAEDPVPFAGGTDNIPKAEVWGVEAETTIKLTSQLQFDGNVAWSKSSITSDYDLIDNVTASQIRRTLFAELGYPYNYYYNATIEQAVLDSAQNARGKSLPKMPEWQANASLTYTADLGGGELTLRGEVTYRGDYNYRVIGDSVNDRVPAYTLFNGYIAYKPYESPFRFSLTATNIGDKDATASLFADPYGSATVSRQYVAPRQVIGTVSLEF